MLWDALLKYGEKFFIFSADRRVRTVDPSFPSVTIPGVGKGAGVQRANLLP